MEMNLEIAEFILGCYDSNYKSWMERLEENVPEGEIYPDCDLDGLAQQGAYDQMEDLIYEDLELEFGFVAECSLSELIYKAEEIVEKSENN